MRLIAKLAVLSWVFALMPFQSSAKGENEKVVYAFGYSTNLNDSIYFLTPVQVLPGASFEKKDGFLEHREVYSRQLKDYLESNYLGHEACAIFIAKNKKKIDKKFAKVRRHLQKLKHSKLIEVPASEFQFKAILIQDEEEKK